MSISSSKYKQRLEEALVKKRDIEYNKQEQTKARERYYIQFNQANTRYETWTDAKYYQQCADRLLSSKIKNEKEQKLEKRRSKLQKLLELEQMVLEDERRILEQGKKSYMKSKEMSGDVLAEIYKQLEIDTETRKVKEIEERLYQHWRKNEGCRLLESTEFKEHQALAKLSWMDKQVQKALHLEKQAKNKKTRIKIAIDQLQNELNALRKQQKELKQACDDLKISIEYEVKCFKEFNEHNESLKNIENSIISSKETFENVSEDFMRKDETVAYERCKIENIKFHKIRLKRYCDLVIKHLNDETIILRRLRDPKRHVTGDKSVQILDSMFPILEQQIKLENERSIQIEAMYDSEASRNWSEYILKWRSEEKDRNEIFTEILNTLRQQMETELKTNIEQQRRNILLKEKHLRSIEDKHQKISLTISDIEFNEGRISAINAELVNLETQHEQITSSQEESVPIIIQSQSIPSPPKHKTPLFISPRYQDSIKNVFNNDFTPCSIFNHKQILNK